MDGVKRTNATRQHQRSRTALWVMSSRPSRTKSASRSFFSRTLGAELRPCARGYKCLCPFHVEDTPSCEITEDESSRNGRFRCWGCGAKGSVIDAVMLKHQFEKPMDAVKWLGREYKLNLPANGTGGAHAHTQHQRRADVIEAEAKRGQEVFWDAASKLGGQARKALRARGLSDETIKAFALGASIDEKSGPRITIPVGDAHGQIITITRRAIFDSFTCPDCAVTTSAKTIAARAKDGKGRECPGCGQQTILMLAVTQTPKYLNESASVSGVQRSKLLYNEHVAAARFLDGKLAGPLVVAEGYGDVWAAHEAGHDAAVAYTGGALSPTQAERLVELALRAQHTKGPRKYLLLVPDFDETGKEGVTKNLNVLQQAATALEDAGRRGAAAGTASGVVVRVLTGVDAYEITDAYGNTRYCKDLGELLQAHGAEVTRKLLEQSTVSPAQWRILAMLDDTRYTRDAQIHGVAQILSSTPYALSLNHLTPELAAHWQLPEAQVSQFLHTHGLQGQSDGRLAQAERLLTAAAPDPQRRHTRRHGETQTAHTAAQQRVRGKANAARLPRQSPEAKPAGPARSSTHSSATGGAPSPWRPADRLALASSPALRAAAGGP